MSKYHNRMTSEVVTPDMLKWSNEEIIRADTAKLIALEADLELQKLKFENESLRNTISKIADNIGNGSFAAPECSLEFMELVAKEVGSVTFGLRAERDALISVALVAIKASNWIQAILKRCHQDRREDIDASGLSDAFDDISETLHAISPKLRAKLKLWEALSLNKKASYDD